MSFSNVTITIYSWTTFIRNLYKDSLMSKEVAEIQMENLKLKTEVRNIKSLWPYS